jgi:SNF family Na+-dependent transporter
VSSTASLITVIAAWAVVLIVVAVGVRMGGERFNKVS